MAKKEKPEEQKEQESAIEPVMEEKNIEPVLEKAEEEKRDEAPRQTFGQIVRRFVLTVLRLIIIVAVIGGCGALIYFGAPFLYDNFVSPVEQNASQMTDLNRRQSQLEFQVADMEEHLATLEAAQNAQSESLAGIASSLQTLEAGQSGQGDAVADLEARIQTLEGADTERNDTLADLAYQTSLLQAMELLSRARLFLYQSNFGLARLDVQAAYDVLSELQATAPEARQRDLSEALFRVDLALRNLPDFPVAASDDLDIAWQILLDGYPVPLTSTPTPLPSLPPAETPTPLPVPTVTPTP